MRLTALRLHDVRRFADRGVAIEGIAEGVNVLSAANEHGKSTCFDALHALFFLPHTSEAEPVRLLRPYSGGHPFVEADIVTPSGRFRLAKRFGGGRRATVTDLAADRIVAQAGEAEAFIASLVQGGTAGPAGLLWVRQGRTGLDRRPKEEDGEKRAREGILSSVRGEVEALTGGRRMAEVARACEDELSRLVTATGRPKAGGPYAAAIEQRDRLAADEERLRAEMTELRAALDRRREVRKCLADLTRPEEEVERRAALARAEAAHAEAGASAEASKAAAAEAALLADRKSRAQQALDAFRDHLGRVRLLAQSRSDAERRRDEAARRRQEAMAGGESARAGAVAAEREEEEAKGLLARLDRAMRAREAAERRAALGAALESARAVRDEMERLEAALRTLSVPAGDLRRLEKLEVEIAGRRAAVAAKAATLKVDYAPGAGGAISLDGIPLGEGEERMLPGPARIGIAGIGTLTVTLPRPAAEMRALEEAEAERRAILERLGVADLAAARLREAAARDRAGEIEVSRQRLALLAPRGLAALQEEWARLGPAEPPPESLTEKGKHLLRHAEERPQAASRSTHQRCASFETPAPRAPQDDEGRSFRSGSAEIPDVAPAAARAALAEATERVVRARQAEREAQPIRDRADAALIEAEKALAAVASDLAAVEGWLGPEAGREARLAALHQDLAVATEAALAAEARAAALRFAAADLPRLEAALLRARSVVERARAEEVQLREELADLSGLIRARSEEGVEEAFAETAEAREAADSGVARLAKEVAVLGRLRSALEAARNAARDHYFQPVMRELSPLLGLLFDDASVTFDEATLLPHLVSRNGFAEPIGALSGGAREQLAVLTRLAFGRLLARQGHPAPVILDDALVYSDDDRIERMFEALHAQSREQQIIVFSCRQRAFSRLGGNVLRMVPWDPAR